MNKILHLGFGAFHRAHQLVYTQEANEISKDKWSYYEVNLRSGINVINNLTAQNNELHILEKGKNYKKLRKLDLITQGLHPQIDGINSILEKMIDPTVAIVSLTITEKGYYINPINKKLNFENQIIQQDLNNIAKPSSAIAYIVRALQLRKEHCIPPFSVMSCDNLIENGNIIKNAILEFSQRIDSELSLWIKNNVSFPCTMVDRIVPAMSEESFAEIETLLGYKDHCAVICEEFKQWVIEDNFVSGRPKWELSGAILVKDVKPFEKMKLRMLNGSHSFLAYLGYLSGYEYISDCMYDENLQKAAYNLMLNEQAPTLNISNTVNLTQYADNLIERYQNTNIKHRTWQIAMDGSQKLPIRILESIQYHIHHGSSFTLLALCVAAWIRFIAGIDEKGCHIEVIDPMAEQFQKIYQQHGLNEQFMNNILKLESIFPKELTTNSLFIQEVRNSFNSLIKIGAKQTITNYLSNQ